MTTGTERRDADSSGGIEAMLAEASDTLRAAGVSAPRHDAEALLAHVLGGTPGAWRTATEPPAELARATFRELVRRRATREPLQHLLGSVGFRYLDLVVGPGVFVPRPETELLAGAAIDELRRLGADADGGADAGAGAGTAADQGRVRPLAVDLCTGSGAVAASMATETAATVVAVELSPDAYDYAVRNAAPHGVEVRLGDMADSVDDLAGRVHVVTANPPYIPLEEFESVAPEARCFDPALALWSGPDGLDAMRVVERVAARLLVGDGLVLCEHADSQSEVAVRLFADTGRWHHVVDHLDLTRRPRFVTARRVAQG